MARKTTKADVDRIYTLETMTAEEEQKMRDLNAKYKRIARQKADIEAYCMAHRDEILGLLGLSDISEAYGCTIEELMVYIASDGQIHHYRKTHSQGQSLISDLTEAATPMTD